jgi:ribonuclease Z
MPCDNFVKASQDVTMMIHEATMGDEEQSLALEKKHSTFSEALSIAQR